MQPPARPLTHDISGSVKRRVLITTASTIVNVELALSLKEAIRREFPALKVLFDFSLLSGQPGYIVQAHIFDATRAFVVQWSVLNQPPEAELLAAVRSLVVPEHLQAIPTTSQPALYQPPMPKQEA